jgi:hypothetical protein
MTDRGIHAVSCDISMALRFHMMGNEQPMKRVYPTLPDLKKEAGDNKQIPEQYAGIILKALHHYPELKNTRITFRLKDRNHEPYRVAPSLLPLRKHYTVTLLEKAEPPTDMALFRHLPDEAKMGAIGHQLSRIVQFETKGFAPALKITNQGSRKIEREADIITIEHGLGFELYTFACFVRAIPGYIEHRKELDINFLHPNEILEAMPPEQLQEVHR